MEKISHMSHIFADTIGNPIAAYRTFSLVGPRGKRPRFLCPPRQAPESGVVSYPSSRVHTRPPKAGIFMVWFILIHAIIVHAMAT